MSSSNEKPIIRINRLVIDNYRNIQHGEIQMNKIPDKADLLGLYGQNGSGKTTAIRAIELIRHLMATSGVLGQLFYPEDINKDSGADHSSFLIELSYKKNNEQCEITYSFDIKIGNNYRPHVYHDKRMNNIIVFNEKIYVKGIFAGKKYTTRKLLLGFENYNYKKSPYEVFSPKETFNDIWNYAITKTEYSSSIGFTDGRSHTVLEDSVADYLEYKSKDDSSTLFGINSSLDFEFDVSFNRDVPATRPLVLLSELSEWAHKNISIVKVKSYGKVVLYYSTPRVAHLYITDQGQRISEEDIVNIETAISTINVVLSSIIPGLKLVAKFSAKNKYDKVFGDEEDKEITVSIFSNRNGKEIDIEEESDGIKRLISFIQGYIRAFNDPSCTLIVDEIDSGLFEFLLGQLLSIFEENGRGQLFFTSHNLRPLEVIDRNHIYFTTANASDRFIQIKNLHKTNNLRDVYLRTVQVHDSEANIYSSKQEFEIVSALIKSGSSDFGGKKKRVVRRPLTEEEKKWVEIINNREFITIDDTESDYE